jgi:uncharacterized protein (TIGR02266 family)
MPPALTPSGRTEPRAVASRLLAVKTVLVADDTEFVRDRFRRAIEDAGHHALTARTGPEVVAAFRQRPSDLHLAVLDLRLPQGNGLALLRAIRKIAPDRPPILVFSGTIASAAEVRALADLGVAGYVNEYTAVQHIVPSLSPHLFPAEYNRRSSPRVTLGIPVAYRFGNTIATALTLNISRGGIAVRTTNPLPVDSTVRVRFRLPAVRSDIQGEARIAWVDHRVGMGLQFTKMDDACQSAVDQFVQSHFFTNRKA